MAQQRDVDPFLQPPATSAPPKLRSWLENFRGLRGELPCFPGGMGAPAPCPHVGSAPDPAGRRGRSCWTSCHALLQNPASGLDHQRRHSPVQTTCSSTSASSKRTHMAKPPYTIRGATSSSSSAPLGPS